MGLDGFTDLTKARGVAHGAFREESLRTAKDDEYGKDEGHKQRDGGEAEEDPCEEIALAGGNPSSPRGRRIDRPIGVRAARIRGCGRLR